VLTPTGALVNVAMVGVSTAAFEGAGCAIDGGNARQCVDAAGRGFVSGVKVGAVTQVGMGIATSLGYGAEAVALGTTAGAFGLAGGLSYLGVKAVKRVVQGTPAQIAQQQADAGALADGILRDLDSQRRRASPDVEQLKQSLVRAQEAYAKLVALFARDQSLGPRSQTAAEKQQQEAVQLPAHCDAAKRLVDDLRHSAAQVVKSADEANKQLAAVLKSGLPPDSLPGVQKAANSTKDVRTNSQRIQTAAEELAPLATKIAAGFSSKPLDRNALAAQIKAYDNLAETLQKDANKVRPEVARFNEARDQYVEQLVNGMDKVPVMAFAVYRQGLDSVKVAEFGADELLNKAYIFVSQSDADVVRFRKELDIAIGLSPDGDPVRDPASTPSCGDLLVSALTDATEAGDTLDKLNKTLDPLKDAWERRQQQLLKVTQSDKLALVEGPGALKKLEAKHDAENAQKLQDLINTASRRERELAQETVIVDGGLTAARDAKQAIDKVAKQFAEFGKAKGG
jgi:hypothetical protein